MVCPSFASVKNPPILYSPFPLAPSPLFPPFPTAHNPSVLIAPLFGWVVVLNKSRLANQMASQMAQMNPGAAGTGMFQPGQDPDKMFRSEAENLEVVEHEYILEGVEDRVLALL